MHTWVQIGGPPYFCELCRLVRSPTKNARKPQTKPQQRLWFLHGNSLPQAAKAGEAATAHWPPLNFFQNHQGVRQHLLLPPFPRPTPSFSTLAILAIAPLPESVVRSPVSIQLNMSKLTLKMCIFKVEMLWQQFSFYGCIYSLYCFTPPLP
ncbi:hypothetical protein [Desulfovibrio intestinalis]|uniref:Uncharacterized protein n=1 Tax=Desulfovibrio intestinalis TaxID=58621 RepID=A0A7W8FG84_9BACT|nr:hypothetical protein [Desulfovibrio intestinalis]MBB5144723.1 hypothetical protein [Desulfovibrio intestinalis]